MEEEGSGDQLEENSIEKDAEKSVDVSQLNELAQQMLQDIPELKTPRCNSIHEAIAKGWRLWMTQGLSAAAKEKLLEEYLRQGNINLDPPQMNPEVLAVVNDGTKARDTHFSDAQKTLGSALSALGRGLSALSSKEELDRELIMRSCIDAGQLLSDLFYRLSTSRRAFIVPGVPDKQIRALLLGYMHFQWKILPSFYVIFIKKIIYRQDEASYNVVWR